jgi:ATP-binding cassette subfamily B protein
MLYKKQSALENLSTQYALKQHLGQQLAQVLGQALSEDDLENCFQEIKILEPNSGNNFWQATTAIPGIYIILGGKVRLLDQNNNLLASLKIGESFGELTLFPQESFQFYSVRASFNLKLAYLRDELLQNLIRKYPKINEHLHQQAILRDLLVLCRRNPGWENLPVEGLIKTLTLMKPYLLETGKLPPSFCQNQKLWLVRKGELLNASGEKLSIGSIYSPTFSPLNKNTWQITTPTELYTLSNSDCQIAQLYLPHLSGLIESDESSLPNLPPLQSLPPVPEASSSFTVSQPSVPPSKRKRRRKVDFPTPTQKVSHLWQRVTRRYPSFIQQSAADCGAACLVMIGLYWGKRLSINRLRDIANVSRQGASMRGVAAAAESMGFLSRPVKASLDQLAKQKLPAIAHWERKHYIVVYEINRKYVIVGDPAVGQRALTHADFKAGWTGNALLLQPTYLLNEAEEVGQPLWQFFELVKPLWSILLEILVISLLIQVFGLVVPVFTQLLLDKVVVQQSTATLNAIGLGLLIFSLFQVAMTGLRQYLLDHTANRVDLALIIGFIRHAFRLPLSYFESRYVGDIISRVHENQKIQRFLTGESLTIFLDIITVFFYVGLMFWYSWKMALLILSLVPLFFLI